MSVESIRQFMVSGQDLLAPRISDLAEARTLCILDSSFNPPTRAHLALAKQALQHYEDASLALLLSTNNADKEAQSASHYLHRVRMMEEFAKDIDKTAAAEGRIQVWLTPHARFIAKLEAIKRAMPESRAKIVFVVGFDTLVRILDPKYYPADVPLAGSLGPLMNHAQLFCLTRQADASTKTPQLADIKSQELFTEQIRNGSLPGIPREWASQIVIDSLAETSGISSSLARNLAISNSPLSDVLTPNVASYVSTSKLYE